MEHVDHLRLCTDGWIVAGSGGIRVVSHRGDDRIPSGKASGSLGKTAQGAGLV